MVMELHRGVENARALQSHACRLCANSPTLWSKTTSRYQCVQNYGGFETGVLLFVNGANDRKAYLYQSIFICVICIIIIWPNFLLLPRGKEGPTQPLKPKRWTGRHRRSLSNFQCSTSQEKRPVSKLAICTLLLSRTTGIMHTVWVRLNAVVFFGLTVLLGLSCLAALSKVGHSYIHQPSKF